jgi:UDP-N-acetylmuramoyl-tripeptide--D-alanyl-D-alanine ligase
MDRVLFTLEEAVDASAARFVGPTMNRDVGGVSIDTRSLRRGDLFIALPGEKSDGHNFIDAAFEAGAAGAVIRKDLWEGFPVERREAGPFILVDDPLKALQDIARMFLDRFPSLVKIAVTGSNGKTTTKEFIAAVLSRFKPTYSSAGNFNSEIGLPLSVFGLKEEHLFAVFELATNRRGEIALLAEILRPNIALVTNVGSAHIGMFGSREAIAEEKSAVFSCFDSSSRGLIWEGDAFREKLREGKRGTFSYFGSSSTPGVEGFESKGLEGGVLLYRGRRIHCALPGEHNLVNVCAAVSVAQICGAGDGAIVAGVESVRSSFGRSEFVPGDVSVYQDCYNANLESFRAGLDVVRGVSWNGRRVGVLGAMKELGKESDDLHRRAGRLCAESGFDAWFFLGAEAAVSSEVYAELSGMPGYQAESFEALESALSGFVRPGDLVYLKGSRAMGLERLTGSLTDSKGREEAC